MKYAQKNWQQYNPSFEDEQCVKEWKGKSTAKENYQISIRRTSYSLFYNWNTVEFKWDQTNYDVFSLHIERVEK